MGMGRIERIENHGRITQAPPQKTLYLFDAGPVFGYLNWIIFRDEYVRHEYVSRTTYAVRKKANQMERGENQAVVTKRETLLSYN